VPTKRTLTISEAAELTGLSRKAIARRIERGSLRSLVRRGRRLVPRAELVRAGLIPPEGNVRERAFEPTDLLEPRSRAPDRRTPSGEESLLVALLRELVDRLERQAGEIAHYRALTAQAESLRLEGQMSELSARLSRLEGARPLLSLERGAEEQLSEAESRFGGDQMPASRPQPSAQPIWLPPSATERPALRPRPGERVDLTEAGLARPSPPAHRDRLIPFFVEALFLVGVAVAAWRADLRPAVVIATMAASWLLVALIEWLRRSG
jgi:excisionase family DNA binding protein